MASTNSSTSKIDQVTLDMLERMDPVEVRRFSEAGAEYFCPLLGADARETFQKISDASGLLMAIIENGLTSEHSNGAALLAQTIWTAAQFSSCKTEACHE